MSIPNNIQSPGKRFFNSGIILFLISFSLILTNLLYIKIYPFQKLIFINLSSSTTSTITSTTDINEILCNNMSDSSHLNLSHNPCEQIRCAVIVRHSGGRLGNRMFMFASAYGLARVHGCRLYTSERINQELSKNFNISINENMRLTNEQLNNMNNIVIKDTVCSFLPDMLRLNAFKYIELQDYWQSYLYFDAYRDEIRNLFIGRSKTLSILAEYFDNITKIDCQTCSLRSFTSHNELRQIIRTSFN